MEGHFRLAWEELLQPIDAFAESGRNLRYDPVFDSIREALSEDDGALPMGNWVRQVKRADYPLVISLAQDSLQKRSKDLWLAAWLGEALIQTEGSDALELALRLLVSLQERFWPSLYPEIEDEDTSLRAAPVQWGLHRFTALIEKFPLSEDGLTYSAYKAVRAGMPWLKSGESLTAESLDEALGSTAVEFYARAEVKLTQALSTLGELQLFCDEHYGNDGPSSTGMRAALEELHGLVAQQLRLRQAEITGTPVSPDLDAGTRLIALWESESAGTADSARQEPAPSALPPVEQAAEAMDHSTTESPHSWEDAMSRVEICAGYLFEQQPENPACYLLAAAMQQGREHSASAAFPRPDTRLALKSALDNQNWSALLVRAMRAMLEDGATCWLDPHRYAWQAAANLGASRLQGLISALLSTQLTDDTKWLQESFEDDTPVANAETQRWVVREITSRNPPPVEKAEAASPQHELINESSELVASARVLAEQGETEQALSLLMNAAGSAQNNRDRFLFRMEISQVCLQADKKSLAANILRQLLAEAENVRLEEWEGRDLAGRLIGMLLEAIDKEEASEERKSLYARLCIIDPARALSIS